ncbi:MAG TPA: response regulator [Verrucomicrobiae bacterium]|nr:response regulator [Verrucomicrobiae bacterium]
MKEPNLVTAREFSRSTILLVDDNDDDTYIFERAWKKAGIGNPLAIVSDGDQAIAYLSGKEPFNDREQHGFPLIVLLDLNMPRKNGFEFLEWVRQQPALRFLTIEVLTSSMRPQDVERALALGANSFFVKPGRIDDLVNLLTVWYQNTCQKTFVTITFP